MFTVNVILTIIFFMFNRFPHKIVMTICLNMTKLSVKLSGCLTDYLYLHKSMKYGTIYASQLRFKKWLLSWRPNIYIAFLVWLVVLGMPSIYQCNMASIYQCDMPSIYRCDMPSIYQCDHNAINLSMWLSLLT